LGETDLHRDEIVDLIYALKERYREVQDVYVAGNLFLYYSRGDRRAVVCPDVFLVKGVAKGPRRTYKLWEEGKAPSFVIEVTSESTQEEDTVEKMGKYARLGVEEYFLFDPLGEYLSPPLRGFRLEGGRYVVLPSQLDGSLPSETTGLLLRPEGGRLRLVDAASGEPLNPTAEEAAARRLEAESRRWEAESRRAAEARADEASAARKAAEARAEAAEARADEEASARRAAEDELARLRRVLAEL
jgi:Uma2 family endonuclease